MPIKSCTLPEGGSGFQWGDSGHCYPTREEAEKQAAAAHANGYVGDDFKESDHPRDTEGKFSFVSSKAKGIKIHEKPLSYFLENPEELNEFFNELGAGEYTNQGNSTGLRGVYSKEIGKSTLKNSSIWESDKPSNKKLSGLSTIGHAGDFSLSEPSEKEIKKIVNLVKNYGDGEAIALVQGLLKTDEDFNDIGEAVLGNPKILGYIINDLRHANGYVGDMALDASARTIDTDGRMHIDRSHISKAAVNPYYGFEIPNAEMLGLDPQKIYYLLRSPEELAKGAETFARLPILKKHIPVSADSPRQDLVVGAIGSEVTFLDPYLDADVCIWDAQAIAGIETETVREFSCAYHYVPLMTPGNYNGEPYDGIMTQIRGNHLALVESGRAGSDVLAADQKMKGIPMKMTKLGKALFVSLTTAFPKLAADTNLPGLLATASKKNFNKAEFRGKVLAMDAAVPGEQLDLVMDAMMDNQEDPEPTEPKKKPAEDEETEEEKKAREKKEKEEKEARDKKAKDEAEEGEKKDREKETKAAMDSFRAELREAEEARREVRPVVGDVLAQDSAADIYTFALDHMKVDHAGVTGVPALKALFKLANTKAAPASRVAQDSAGLVAQFPNAARFRQA